MYICGVAFLKAILFQRQRITFLWPNPFPLKISDFQSDPIRCVDDLGKVLLQAIMRDKFRLNFQYHWLEEYFSFDGPQIRLLLNSATYPLTICQKSFKDKKYGTCSLDEFVKANTFSTNIHFKDVTWNAFCGEDEWCIDWSCCTLQLQLSMVSCYMCLYSVSVGSSLVCNLALNLCKSWFYFFFCSYNSHMFKLPAKVGKRILRAIHTTSAVGRSLPFCQWQLPATAFWVWQKLAE